MEAYWQASLGEQNSLLFSACPLMPSSLMVLCHLQQNLAFQLIEFPKETLSLRLRHEWTATLPSDFTAPGIFSWHWVGVIKVKFPKQLPVLPQRHKIRCHHCVRLHPSCRNWANLRHSTISFIVWELDGPW